MTIRNFRQENKTDRNYSYFLIEEPTGYIIRPTGIIIFPDREPTGTPYTPQIQFNI
jgi:hypothetical protein